MQIYVDSEIPISIGESLHLRLIRKDEDEYRPINTYENMVLLPKQWADIKEKIDNYYLSVDINKLKEYNLWVQKVEEPATMPLSTTKQTGFIYLLKSLSLYKIGKTIDISRRIKKYVTENPHGVELLAMWWVQNITLAEKHLLASVHRNRIGKTEWHNLSQTELLKLIRFADALGKRKI